MQESLCVHPQGHLDDLVSSPKPLINKILCHSINGRPVSIGQDAKI